MIVFEIVVNEHFKYIFFSTQLWLLGLWSYWSLLDQCVAQKQDIMA